MTESHEPSTLASRLLWVPARSVLICSALLLTPAAYPFDDGSGVVAVYSAVSPAYHRTAQTDGSFKPETYAFGEGGNEGGAMKDFTIDNLHFIDVARTIAPALAKKNYLPSKDPHQTDLLIMVYWGTTIGANEGAFSGLYQSAQQMMRPGLPPKPGSQHLNSGSQKAPMGPPPPDPSIPTAVELAEQAAINSALDQSLMITHQANRLRDKQDLENAQVLGYLPELIRLDAYKGTVLNSQNRQDLIDEVEETRYYVVLMAYDFQMIWKKKERKMLWETRFSIREHRNDFSKALAVMAQDASRYFGQDSKGLIRERLPDTRVILGEPKVLEYEQETKK